MKIWRRLLAVLVLGALSAQIIFHYFAAYHALGERPATALRNQAWQQHCDQWLQENPKAGLEAMIPFADSSTRAALDFTFKKCPTEPNRLLGLPDGQRRTNCVGYTALLNSTLLYLMRRQNWADSVSTHHQVGKISLCGLNLHQFFQHPFFKDHDYLEIIDHRSKILYRLDPSLRDGLGIYPKQKNSPK